MRLAIVNNYIEYMPGGCIVLRSTNGIVNRTTIMDNYMETFGGEGLLLDIGSGVTDTVFANNYTNQISSPSNFAIKIANGATGVQIANNTFNGEATAVINNLNLNNAANIVLYNNDERGSSAFFDSAIGIIQHSYGTNSFITFNKARLYAGSAREPSGRSFTARLFQMFHLRLDKPHRTHRDRENRWF